MEFLTEYGLFLAKVATFVVAGIILVSAVVSAAQKDKGDPEFDGELRIRKLNDSYRKLKENIEARLMSDQARKVYEKARKKERKAEKKAAKGKSGETGADEAGRPRVFVLDFDGDIKASDTDQLRRAVSAVLGVAEPGRDEVVVRLESGGGLVHAYGLAAAQLDRDPQQRCPAHRLRGQGGGQWWLHDGLRRGSYCGIAFRGGRFHWRGGPVA